MARIRRYGILAFGFLSVLAGTSLGRMERRMDLLRGELAGARRDTSLRDRRLTRDIDRARGEIETLCGRMTDAAREEMLRRLDAVEERLASADAARRADIERIKRFIAEDSGELARDLLTPCVQVNGGGGVGGGVMIHARSVAGGRTEGIILTACHVIQKAVRPPEEGADCAPIEIKVFAAAAGEPESYPASVLAWDEKKDLALLRVETDRALPPCARMASRMDLRRVGVCTPVVAVGCPLGHEPLPTPGEITSLRKEIGGEHFWMMNAPTIFGNSGGGIFLRETRELVGISSMICTYDHLVSTPVPHMGIMVSLETVYDWLDSRNLAWMYDPTASTCDAASAPPPGAARVAW